MGTTVYAPTLYTWYKWLDRTFPGTAKPIIVKKLVLDQFVLTPYLLTVFYTGMSLMERAQDPFKELREKFVPTFLRSCIFWLPVQTLNFILIAPRFRVIYMGVCGFIWVNILCWIKRQRNELQSESEVKVAAQ
ncbi:PREDICTED: mpv17-like protein [Rhagoletis zephyria]|uniref:mpv17-like protein n=1 Tax=Rhagoletis zephyria TaxID=28612 RepID=UPI0008116FF1|nr:PREDICTED: mpv17-like protein [Rhagoletis zephyria]